MSSHDPFPPDDLDALLTPTALPPNNALQQSLLHQTRGVVRRRRYVRRLAQAAALVVCYVAGAATMRVWQPAPAAVSVATVERPSPASAASVVRAMPKAAVKSPAKAAEPTLSPYEKLRRYSDRLLDEKGDIPRAARYYAQALKKATAEEQAISSDDTWLLMAVKRDRMQEKSDVRHGS